MPTTKTLKQVVLFQAAPEQVYALIMDAKLHGRLTHSRVIIKPKVGSPFKVYGGDIVGKNVALEPGKRIVQSWRIETEGWPGRHMSTVTFRFSKHKKGTRLAFTHSGIPVDAYQEIKEGWNEYYWKPMKKMLAKA